MDIQLIEANLAQIRVQFMGEDQWYKLPNISNYTETESAPPIITKNMMEGSAQIIGGQQPAEIQCDFDVLPQLEVYEKLYKAYLDKSIVLVQWWTAEKELFRAKGEDNVRPLRLLWDLVGSPARVHPDRVVVYFKQPGKSGGDDITYTDNKSLELGMAVRVGGVKYVITGLDKRGGITIAQARSESEIFYLLGTRLGISDEALNWIQRGVYYSIVTPSVYRDVFGVNITSCDKVSMQGDDSIPCNLTMRTLTPLGSPKVRDEYAVEMSRIRREREDYSRTQSWYKQIPDQFKREINYLAALRVGPARNKLVWNSIVYDSRDYSIVEQIAPEDRIVFEAGKRGQEIRILGNTLAHHRIQGGFASGLMVTLVNQDKGYYTYKRMEGEWVFINSGQLPLESVFGACWIAGTHHYIIGEYNNGKLKLTQGGICLDGSLDILNEVVYNQSFNNRYGLRGNQRYTPTSLVNVIYEIGGVGGVLIGLDGDDQQVGHYYQGSWGSSPRGGLSFNDSLRASPLYARNDARESLDGMAGNIISPQDFPVIGRTLFLPPIRILAGTKHLSSKDSSKRGLYLELLELSRTRINITDNRIPRQRYPNVRFSHKIADYSSLTADQFKQSGDRITTVITF